MSMLDDLNQLPETLPKTDCKLSSLAGDRIGEVLELAAVQNRSLSQKLQVLSNHGIVVSRNTLRRHTREIIGTPEGCKSCRSRIRSK